jgi:hypothetical protein
MLILFQADKVTTHHLMKNMDLDLCLVSALGEHLALKFAPGAIDFSVPLLEDSEEWCVLLPLDYPLLFYS